MVYNRMGFEQKQLECPFTWGIEKQWARDYDEMEEPIVKYEDEPLLSFLSSIMLTYTRAEKEDYEGACCSLKNTDSIWKKLVNSQLETIEVSTQILRHVKIATEYFIYDLTGRKVEAKSLLKILESSEFLESTFEGTIDGCKSVAWSSFHEVGDRKAEAFARLATSKSPNCPLWHYILGKSLRLSRHEVYGNFNPTDEEQQAFITSCELSDTPFYKIHLAQMYREKLDYRPAQDIYLKIFRTKPKSSGILLRLASGLMSIHDDFERAQKCLCEARKNGQTSMFHHCLGIFYSRQKKHALAAEQFEMAALKGKNYKADLQHAASLQRLNKDYNLVEHLEKMLVKHGQNSKYKQQMLLHMAMQYYFRNIDIEKSLSYFVQAIEMHPKSQQLDMFFNSTVDYRTYNIYNFVKKILQYNEWYQGKSSNVKYDGLKKLENYWKAYQKSQVSESREQVQLFRTYYFIRLFNRILQRFQSYFLTLSDYFNEKVKLLNEAF